MNHAKEEIINRFEQSWDETEASYDSLVTNYEGWERLIPLLAFIRGLKVKGENKHYRIGTSLHMLLFSRSVDFGLRDDQKRIVIDTVGHNDYLVTLRNGLYKYREYRINDLDDNRLQKLLKTLKDTLID